jgi:hypothetical protein
VKRLSRAELDAIAHRLEEIELEQDNLRRTLTEQIQEFGFLPPRAEMSRRLLGEAFAFTLSTSQTNEIIDSEVEKIREACPDEVFSKLFTTVTKFKLAATWVKCLAAELPHSAPRNLRWMFAKAVLVKESAPRLRIDKIEAEAA